MLWHALCAEDPDLNREVRRLQQTFNQFAHVIPLQAPSQNLLDEMRLATQQQLGVKAERGSLSISGARDRHPSDLRGRGLTAVFGVAVGLGVGAIAFLSTQVYGLRYQVQQLNQQLEAQQQHLQKATTERADLHRQLDGVTAQLTTIEDALVQAQEREEAMHKRLQQLTPDLSDTP